MITEGNITKKPRKIACCTFCAQAEKKMPNAMVANMNTRATSISSNRLPLTAIP